MVQHHRFLRGIAILAALATVGTAHAQWTVTNLHPAGATNSVINGSSGTSQVGQIDTGTGLFAGLWNGTAASFVNLNPTGINLIPAESSNALGAGGNQQAGLASFAGVVHAGTWNGNAASFNDLHPAGADYSIANSTDGTQQVGNVGIGGSQFAALWSGIAAGWVNLNPAGALASNAYGISGGQQIGSALGGDFIQRASLWKGSAASWVSLHPAGADSSEAFGVQGGKQVGYVFFGGSLHAGLWSGTAASFVDLHPAIAAYSWASAVDRKHQVGFAGVGGVSHASIWNNTAGSWIDLHSFLPPEFTESFATGVVHTAANTIVSGYGYNSLTFRNEAPTWTGPPLVISWSGFLQPINQDGSSIFKIGQTIPVKFKLTGDDAGNGDLVVYLHITRVTLSETGTVIEPETPCDEDSGMVFRYQGGTYQYNLGTKGFAPGTWRLCVDLGDGIVHTVLITLRK